MSSAVSRLIPILILIFGTPLSALGENIPFQGSPLSCQIEDGNYAVVKMIDGEPIEVNDVYFTKKYKKKVKKFKSKTSTLKAQKKTNSVKSSSKNKISKLKEKISTYKNLIKMIKLCVTGELKSENPDTPNGPDEGGDGDPPGTPNPSPLSPVITGISPINLHFANGDPNQKTVTLSGINIYPQISDPAQLSSKLLIEIVGVTIAPIEYPFIFISNAQIQFVLRKVVGNFQVNIKIVNQITESEELLEFESNSIAMILSGDAANSTSPSPSPSISPTPTPTPTPTYPAPPTPVPTPIPTVPPPGTTVAKISHRAANNQLSHHIIRATIPILGGAYDESSANSPFVVEEYDGTPVPAQVEVVTRNALGQPEILEVIADVRRDPGAVEGALYNYNVNLSPVTKINAVNASSLANFMNLPGANSDVLVILQMLDNVLVQARDHEGSGYTAKILGGHKKIHRDGRYARTMETFNLMTPDQPNSAFFDDHFLGIRTVYTVYPDYPVILVDLEFSNSQMGYQLNGTAKDNNNHAYQQLYFDSLDLLLPPGWEVKEAYDDVNFGPSGISGKTHIVKPNNDGTLHWISHAARGRRRLALYKTGYTVEANAYLKRQDLGFSARPASAPDKSLWSWWNPSTAHFLQQRMLMPDLNYLGINNVENSLSSNYNSFYNYVHNGNGDGGLIKATLGWAKPQWEQYGGVTGGGGINLADCMFVANAASQKGYMWHDIKGQMVLSRQPTGYYDQDGRPLSAFKWLDNGINTIPFELMVPTYKMASSSGFSYSSLIPIVSNADQAWYKTQLQAFDPIDNQHLARHTRPQECLAYLGNDPLAKHEVRVQAENARFSDRMEKTTGKSWAWDSIGHLWFWNPMDLNASQYHALKDYKGYGGNIGRGNGWRWEVVTTAYSMAEPAWRAKMLSWFEDVVKVIDAAQMQCSGIIQSHINPGKNPTADRYVQFFEHAIVVNAIEGIQQSVFEGTANPKLAMINQVLDLAYYAMVADGVWNDSLKMPNNRILIQMAQFLDSNGQPMPVFCPGEFPLVNNGTKTDNYFGNAFARAYETTLDPNFYHKAKLMSKGSTAQSLTQILQGQMTDSNPKNINGVPAMFNYGMLLALAQDQGI